MDDKARNRLLLVLFLGVLMAALDIAVTGPALPAMTAQLQMSASVASWIFGIYIVANLVSTPLLAKASDRYGRRTSFLASVLLFGLGSLVVANAQDVTVLLVGRAIQGFGAGGIFPVASAVVGDVFPVEQRGRALGMIGAVFGIAFLIGPIIGGVLLMFGWPWLFWINLPIVALIIVLGLKLLPVTGGNDTKPFDTLGSILMSVILIGLAYGLQGIGDPQLALVARIAALVALPVFVWVERRAADPVVNMGLFGRRQILLVLALAFGSGVAEAVTLYLPSLLVAAQGMTPSAASFQLVPLVLAMAVASPLSGRVLDKTGAKPVVVTGMLLMTVGLALLAFVPSSMVVFYAFSVLFGFGIAVLLGAALRYMMLGETSESERAPAQALLTITISIGQMIGAAMMGAVAAQGGGAVAGYGQAMLVTAIVMGVLTVLGLLLKNIQAPPKGSAPVGH
jgi:EmrB/QacA subfamily drug resistance transporter